MIRWVALAYKGDAFDILAVLRWLDLVDSARTGSIDLAFDFWVLQLGLNAGLNSCIRLPIWLPKLLDEIGAVPIVVTLPAEAFWLKSLVRFRAFCRA